MKVLFSKKDLKPGMILKLRNMPMLDFVVCPDNTICTYGNDEDLYRHEWNAFDRLPKAYREYARSYGGYHRIKLSVHDLTETLLYDSRQNYHAKDCDSCKFKGMRIEKLDVVRVEAFDPRNPSGERIVLFDRVGQIGAKTEFSKEEVFAILERVTGFDRNDISIGIELGVGNKFSLRYS